MALLCLMYHDIHRGAPEAWVPASSAIYHVDAARFQRHLGVLEESGRSVVGLSEGVAEPASRTVVLTFDDGWRGTFETALPAVRRLGWTATVFITRDYIGRPGFGTERMIVDAADAGFEIGVHGTTHRLLAACSTDEIVREFTDCRAYLEDLLGRPVDLASLPGGSADRRVSDCARQAGLRVLCTSRPGLNTAATPLLALRRIAVTDRSSDADVARYCRERIGREHARWAVMRAPRKILGDVAYARLRRRILDRDGAERRELFAP